MNHPPQVSIVLANWNGGRFLDSAIESVVRQTFTDWIFIVVDTGSEDESRAILERWAAVDQRIKPTFIANRLNYPTAVNLGLAQARGEYIARIESDDLWHPHRLETQVAFLAPPDMARVGICGSAADLIDETGRVLGVKRYPASHQECLSSIWYRSPFCHSSVLIRRAVFDEGFGGYDEAFLPAEDLDLWFRIAQKWEMCNLAESLISYRVWPGSVTSRKLPQAVWNGYRIRSHAVRELGFKRPPLGVLYGLASLGVALLPPRLVRPFFQFLLNCFGGGGKARRTPKLEAIPPMVKPVHEKVP